MGLKRFHFHVEFEGANDEAISIQSQELCMKLSNAAENNTFIGSKCSLMYRIPPDSRIAKQALPARKNQKYMFTTLVCRNADGTEKYPNLVIGYAQSPGPSKKKYVYEYSLDSYLNCKA